jgi:hypothetical protein
MIDFNIVGFKLINELMFKTKINTTPKHPTNHISTAVHFNWKKILHIDFTVD